MIDYPVGYTGERSYGDKPYSRLKPGQKTLDRDYYSIATSERPNGTKCLENFSRFTKEYGAALSKTVKVGDYTVPSKDANIMVTYDLGHQPELFAYSRRAAFMAAKAGTPQARPEDLAKVGDVHARAKSASHWGSVYKTEVLGNCEHGRIASRRPLWSLPREAYTSKRGSFTTEFQNSFGKHGHNPRNLLAANATKLGNQVNENTIGTTKVTTHIPSYNGFLPRSDFNTRALKQSELEGGRCRNTIVKQNIVENYCVKLPGYSGHKPMSTLNDRGVPRPNCLNSEGERF